MLLVGPVLDVVGGAGQRGRERGPEAEGCLVGQVGELAPEGPDALGDSSGA